MTDGGQARTWDDALDVFEQTIERAEEALAAGEWPEDGFDGPSIAVPDGEPREGHAVRYRALAQRADEVTARIKEQMEAVASELASGRKRRDAVRGYTESAAYEKR